MWRGFSLGLVGLLVLLGALATGSLRPAPVDTVSLFNRRCASCHGKEGARFEAQFHKKYAHESELIEMVKSMPGAEGLNEEGLQAMTAYMRAISREEPYLIWTEQREGVLEGEVSPASATLKASAKRQSLKVERPSGNRWRIQLPAKVKPAEVELTAQRGTKRTTLRLKDAPYSHHK